MKKILISTYCQWTSFGSMLQALGLQQFIRSIGVEPSSVTYAEEKAIPSVQKVKIRPNVETVNYLFRCVNRYKLDRGRAQSLAFMKEYIALANISTRANLMKEMPAADVYLAGSDQIWHPALCREDFFLNHAPKDKRRISYAASMGVLDIPRQNEKKFADLLQNFDAFSVREAEMVPIIERYTHKKVFQHIDPTFLVPAAQWRNYEKRYDIQKPFILVYALYWDRSLNRQLKKLHQKTTYQIVSIQNGLRSIYANKIILDAGPAEFLWLIDHAEAVVTSSFHGTAFSVIFNKRFYPAVNPNAPSRIDSLLKTLGVHTPDSLDTLMEYTPNYSEVNISIEREKARSMDYLRKEINEDE